MEIGRVCRKIAGRDGGSIAVVIDNIDDNYVMVDGYVRRKRCNVKHLDPTELVIKISKNASTDEIRKAINNAKLPIKKERNFIKNFKPKTKEIKETKEEKKIKIKKETSKKKTKNNAK